MRTAILVIVLLAAFCATSAFAKLAFTVYADWGIKSDYAKTLAKVSDNHKSQFIAAIGDNFYGQHGDRHFGIKSVDDPKWKSVFENVYTQPFFKKRWYVVAGNHDYNGNELAQVEYTSRSDRWYFPSLYYTFTKSVGADSVQFFMLDTTPMYYSEKELAQSKFNVKSGKDVKQVQWLEAELKKSTAKWRIVMGHHQVYTAHGGNQWMKQQLAPLFQQYGVSVYLNGHIHNVQHVKVGKIHYATIGNAAFQQPASSSNKALFVYPTKKQFKSKTCRGNNCRGFAIAEILDSSKMQLVYYNKLGKELKTIKIKNAN